jgi:hypothetical protein
MSVLRPSRRDEDDEDTREEDRKQRRKSKRRSRKKSGLGGLWIFLTFVLLLLLAGVGFLIYSSNVEKEKEEFAQRLLGQWKFSLEESPEDHVILEFRTNSELLLHARRKNRQVVGKTEWSVTRVKNGRATLHMRTISDSSGISKIGREYDWEAEFSGDNQLKAKTKEATKFTTYTRIK